MASDSMTETLTVEADVETVYDTVADFEAYPEWLDEFKEAEILETFDDGWAKTVRFRLGAAGISLPMVLAYTYTDTRVDWSLVEGDMLTRNDGAYVLADNGDGTTDVTYELAVDSNIPLPGMVRRRVAKKIIVDSLKAIKKRAEAA